MIRYDMIFQFFFTRMAQVVGDKYPFVLHSQHHSFWWSGDTGIQVISCRHTDLVPTNYSGLSTRSVNNAVKCDARFNAVFFFFKILTTYTPQLARGARYWVSFVISTSHLCSTAANAVLRAISWYIGPRYDGTRQYSSPIKGRCRSTPAKIYVNIGYVFGKCCDKRLSIFLIRLLNSLRPSDAYMRQ